MRTFFPKYNHPQIQGLSSDIGIAVRDLIFFVIVIYSSSAQFSDDCNTCFYSVSVQKII